LGSFGSGPGNGNGDGCGVARKKNQRSHGIPSKHREHGGLMVVEWAYDGWLVVWNMNFMTSHILGRIIPTDFHIFQRD